MIPGIIKGNCSKAVFIDGQYVGNAPSYLASLPAGTYTVRSGAQSETVSLGAGQTVTVNFS